MKYAVQLTYPRASRQPVYGTVVEAETQAEALMLAETWAQIEG